MYMYIYIHICCKVIQHMCRSFFFSLAGRPWKHINAVVLSYV